MDMGSTIAAFFSVYQKTKNLQACIYQTSKRVTRLSIVMLRVTNYLHVKNIRSKIVVLLFESSSNILLPSLAKFLRLRLEKNSTLVRPSC